MGTVRPSTAGRAVEGQGSGCQGLHAVWCVCGLLWLAGVGCCVVGCGGVFAVAGGAAGVLGEYEAEHDQALAFGAERDEAAVPQVAVELGEDGFGVVASGVGVLVDAGVFGDRCEMLGAVKLSFLVAMSGLALAFDGGDPDGLSVGVRSVGGRGWTAGGTSGISGCRVVRVG